MDVVKCGGNKGGESRQDHFNVLWDHWNLISGMDLNETEDPVELIDLVIFHPLGWVHLH